MAEPSGAEALDEAYERLFSYGPEFDGGLSNHGPMVVEVLQRRACGDAIHAWLDEYTTRLEPPPELRWKIGRDDWHEALGDGGRVGDWAGYFGRELQERPWQDVVAEWWPRLLPGAVGAATHGIIRTGHALRSLQSRDTPSHVGELALALGYWAALFRPLPAASGSTGTLGPREALDHLPRIGDPSGGAAARVSQLGDDSPWTHALSELAPPPDRGHVRADLDALVDATVAQYLDYGRSAPIMLVHAATSPAAAAAALASLPEELWQPTWTAAWSASAAITACYGIKATEAGKLVDSLTPTDVLGRAVENGDEHVIKFTDVALLAHERGCPSALSAARHAASLVS